MKEGNRKEGRKKRRKERRREGERERGGEEEGRKIFSGQARNEISLGSTVVQVIDAG